MCNQTTVDSYYQRKNRKWEHLRKKPTKTAKIAKPTTTTTTTTNFSNFFNYNGRCDLNVQQKIIAISLIGISLLVNCQLIAASNLSSTARSNHQYYQQYTNNINNNNDNNNNNHDGRRHTAWNDFQTKMLRQRSVPAYQSPQDLGDIFSQLGVLIQARQRNATELATNVFFKYYNSKGELINQSNLSSPRDLYAARCSPKERFAIILHGWKEDCNADWSQQLIKKLGQHRGGCIVCMDFGRYASESYVRLVRLFDPLAQILTLQLYLLDYMGFDMNNGYLFGFSYGGQLATEAGRRIGYRRLKEIDTCDMAGPGFDHRSNQPNHRDAAQNVQCIHTSRDKGTRFYNCHQDWRLGNCGLTQIASNSPPLGSHGLCPYMYVNSFDHEFYAIEKPKDCISKHQASYWPNHFKMGYMENRKRQVSGELFAHTSRFHPFNLISNGSENNAIIQEQYRDVPLTMQEILPDGSVIHSLKEKILRYIFLDHN